MAVRCWVRIWNVRSGLLKVLSCATIILTRSAFCSLVRYSGHDEHTMYKIHCNPKDSRSALKHVGLGPMVHQDGGIWVRTHGDSVPGTSRCARKGQKYGSTCIDTPNLGCRVTNATCFYFSLTYACFVLCHLYQSGYSSGLIGKSSLVSLPDFYWIGLKTLIFPFRNPSQSSCRPPRDTS